MRHRPISKLACIAGIGLVFLAAGCSSARVRPSTATSTPRTAISWNGGTSAKPATFAVLGVATDQATLVDASFTPSNDVLAMGPNVSDFSEGRWLFTATLVIADATVRPGVYSGETLRNPILYTFDPAKQQTNSQLLSTADAQVTIATASNGKARGTITLNDTEHGFSVRAPFTASIRTS